MKRNLFICWSITLLAGCADSGVKQEKGIQTRVIEAMQKAGGDLNIYVATQMKEAGIPTKNDWKSITKLSREIRMPWCRYGNADDVEPLTYVEAAGTIRAEYFEDGKAKAKARAKQFFVEPLEKILENEITSWQGLDERAANTPFCQAIDARREEKRQKGQSTDEDSRVLERLIHDQFVPKDRSRQDFHEESRSWVRHVGGFRKALFENDKYNSDLPSKTHIYLEQNKVVFERNIKTINGDCRELRTFTSVDSGEDKDIYVYKDLYLSEIKTKCWDGEMQEANLELLVKNFAMPREFTDQMNEIYGVTPFHPADLPVMKAFYKKYEANADTRVGSVAFKLDAGNYGVSAYHFEALGGMFKAMDSFLCGKGEVKRATRKAEEGKLYSIESL